MVVHSYTRGCYNLVVADPAADTGRVFYILQIPVQTWCDNWGGAIELYSSTYDPTSVEAHTITPARNRLVLYNGQTRQSVTEVIAPEPSQMICITGSFRPLLQGSRRPESNTPIMDSGVRVRELFQSTRSNLKYNSRRGNLRRHIKDILIIAIHFIQTIL